MIRLITVMTVAEAKKLRLALETETDANSKGSVWLAFDAAMNRIYKGRLPYCGTARLLLEQGYDPEDILQGQTPGGQKTLSAPIGIFAKLTIKQRDPVRVPGGNKGKYQAESWTTYKPYPGAD